MNRDCLGNIAEKLFTISDYRSFRLVCQDWASAVPKLPRHHVSIPPLLMLLERQLQLPKDSRGSKMFCSYINIISDDNTSTLQWHSANLPDVLSPDHRVIGSSHGFLIAIGLTGQIICLNPISKKQVTLPPLSEFPDVEQFTLVNDHEGSYRVHNQFGYPQNLSLTQMRDWYLKKIILSSSPADGADFMALAIIQSGNLLAYCKRGDKCWEFIPFNTNPDSHRSIADIAYFNGILSGLSYGPNSEELIICEFTGSNPVTTVIDAKVPRAESDIKVHDYLVIFEDDLGIFLVSRYMSKGNQKISVYKFNVSNCLWASQETLNGKLIFLGLNSALSFQASDFHGCEENTIYILGDSLEQKDMGMFKFSNQRIERLPCFSQDEFSLCNFHPIWFTPNPW